MIRPLIFCTLLSISAIVLAQPLYKWVEPDGSITFSVELPPSGVKYEIIEPSASNGDPSIQSNDAIRSEQAPTIKQLQPTALPVEPTQRVAPQLGVQATKRSGIQRGSQNASDAEPTQAPSGADESFTSNNPGSDERLATVSAKIRKQQQCEDLKKRVVSLERRLKTRLTPDDMDNTVVHMARYQRSYDHHCVQ